jgi:hypothetical protein
MSAVPLTILCVYEIACSSRLGSITIICFRLETFKIFHDSQHNFLIHNWSAEAQEFLVDNFKPTNRNRVFGGKRWLQNIYYMQQYCFLLDDSVK